MVHLHYVMYLFQNKLWELHLNDLELLLWTDSRSFLSGDNRIVSYLEWQPLAVLQTNLTIFFNCTVTIQPAWFYALLTVATYDIEFSNVTRV